MSQNQAAGIEVRQQWMAVLARAGLAELQTAWDDLKVAANFQTGFQTLRAPERGLVMARGRAGGSGAPFNLGEITVTRCSVRAPGGHIGHATCLGTDVTKAEIAARFDALLQDPAQQSGLLDRVIDPLARTQADARAVTARKAAATKVEFFTMVRGES